MVDMANYRLRLNFIWQRFPKPLSHALQDLTLAKRTVTEVHEQSHQQMEIQRFLSSE